MQRTARDRFVDVQVAVADLDVEPAARVCARPGFEVNRRALAAEVRQRHQVSFPAFLTFGERRDVHPVPPPPTRAIGIHLIS